MIELGVEEAMGEGVGEEAGLAAGEGGEGDGGGRGFGIEVVEPEAEGSGVALEVAVSAGLASDEAGDEILDGGGVEEGEEGPELGGVPPVLEGVEVADGGAGAGSCAASRHGCEPPLEGWASTGGAMGRAKALQLRVGTTLW